MLIEQIDRIQTLMGINETQNKLIGVVERLLNYYFSELKRDFDDDELYQETLTHSPHLTDSIDRTDRFEVLDVKRTKDYGITVEVNVHINSDLEIEFGVTKIEFIDGYEELISHLKISLNKFFGVVHINYGDFILNGKKVF